MSDYKQKIVDAMQLVVCAGTATVIFHTLMSPGIEYVLIDSFSFTYHYLYKKKVKVNIKCLSIKNILNSKDMGEFGLLSPASLFHLYEM